MRAMAISNEQKVAAFDGIMDLIGKEALGEWKFAGIVPERSVAILMIAKISGKPFYITGYYDARIKEYTTDAEEVIRNVICWKYDDAENIVKLLKL